MNKKKAIKIATASAIAASAFVAPVASQAAVNYSKLVKDTNAVQVKAFNLVNNAVKAGEMPDRAEANAAFSNAKKAYVAAANAVKKAPAKDRVALRKSLDDNYKKFALPVYNYVVASDAFKPLNDEFAKLSVAKDLEAKKAGVAVLEGLLSDSGVTAKLNASVAKALFAQEVERIAEFVKVVKEEIASTVTISDVTTEVKETTLTVTAAIKNFEGKEAVAKVYPAGDLTKTAVEVKGAVKDGKASFKFEKLPAGEHKVVVEATNGAALVKSEAKSFKVEAPVYVGVTGVKATSSTTVEVTLEKEATDVKASDFTIEGLEVKAAAFKQESKKVVVLTTAAQDGSKEYVVKYAGKEGGKFKGVSAVLPTAIEFTKKANSVKVGTEFKLQAKVTVPKDQSAEGIPVTFNIDAPAGSLNKDIVVEVMTNKDGVAEYNYTQYSGDTDDVAVYPTGAPTVRSVGKVYWGVQDRLTVTKVDTAAVVNNEFGQVYKVKYTDAKTGLPLSGQSVKVTFAENADDNVANNTNAVVVNQFGGQAVTPFQTSTAQQAFTVLTDINGEATFVVRGTNTKVTPVAFVENIVNDRLDTTELQATGTTVEFAGAQLKYVIKSTETAPTTAAFGLTNFKTYKVTVFQADGTTPYAGGTVHVGFNEDMDNNYFTNTDAVFVDGNGVRVTTVSGANQDGDISGGASERIRLTTNAKGEATFRVASPSGSNMQTATPLVWIDQNAVNGQQGFFETGEPSLTLPAVTFVNEVVAKSNFEVSNAPSAGPFITGDTMDFTLQAQNQSGVASNTAKFSTVTYTVTNTSNTPIRFSPVATGTFTPASTDVITLAAGNSVTIQGVANSNAATLKLTVPTQLDGTTTANGSISVSSVGVTTALDAANNARTFTGAPVTASFLRATSVTAATGKIVGFSKADGTYNGTTGYGRVIVELDGTPGTYGAYVYGDSGYRVGIDGTFTNVTSNFNLSTVSGFENAITLNDRILVDAADNKVYLANIDGSVNGGTSGLNGGSVANNVPVAKVATQSINAVKTINVSDLATDADTSDTLTITGFTVSDSTIFTTSTTTTALTVTPIKAGKATVTVNVTDGKATIPVTFDVTVTNGQVVVNPAVPFKAAVPTAAVATIANANTTGAGILKVTLDATTGKAFYVDLATTDNDAAKIAAAINARAALAGYANVASVEGTALKVTSPTTGTSSKVKLEGSTALTLAGTPGTTNPGTGDATTGTKANISLATANATAAGILKVTFNGSTSIYVDLATTDNDATKIATKINAVSQAAGLGDVAKADATTPTTLVIESLTKGTASVAPVISGSTLLALGTVPAEQTGTAGTASVAQYSFAVKSQIAKEAKLKVAFEGKTYELTAKDSGGNTATQFQIGADVKATVQNIVAALNTAGGFTGYTISITGEDTIVLTQNTPAATSAQLVVTLN